MKITRLPLKNKEGLELSETVIYTNRVAKVVKGGRRFSFNALTVVGDGHGHIGISFGKANELSDAIKKSVENAKRRIYKININKNTIPHEIIGKFKSARILLKPASPGTGIIAGPKVKAVLEKAGIADVLTKAQGSRNPLNLAKAALDGLLQLRSLKEVADLREVPLNKVMDTEKQASV